MIFSHLLQTPPHKLSVLSLLCFFLLAASTENTTTSSGNLPTPTGSTAPSFIIDPDLTISAYIVLEGSVETLNFTFTQDSNSDELYQLQILNGKQIVSSQVAQFTDQETISLYLDTTRNIFTLQGNKRFRISKSVREKQYQYTISQTQIAVTSPTTGTNPGTQTDSDDGSEGSSGVSSSMAYIILGAIVGGIVGLVVIIKVIMTLIEMRRTHLLKQAMIFAGRVGSNRRELDAEGNPQGEEEFEDQESPQKRNSFNLLNEKQLEERIASGHHIKKDFVSSLGSIDHGNNLRNSNASKLTASNSLLTNPTLNSNPSVNSINILSKDTISEVNSRNDEGLQSTNSVPFERSKANKVSNGGSKVVLKKLPHQLTAITEEYSLYRKNPVIEINSPAETSSNQLINRRTKKKTTKNQIAPIDTSNHYMNANSSYKISIETPSPTKSPLKSPIKASPTRIVPQPLPFSNGPRLVTMDDIQKIVDKVMREKASEASDEGSDTEREEKVVNYFTCLICENDKRSMVVEPCGHVFGCKVCTKKILRTSKICQQCHHPITGYQNIH